MAKLMLPNALLSYFESCETYDLFSLRWSLSWLEYVR